MFKTAIIALALTTAVRAETHPMTLRQAVELALKQNPDLALVRLDEEKARQAVRIAHDPFTPRVTVGSGLAYSNGFPMSIEGSAPSVIQARANQFIFNRQQSFTVAQAKEDARGASFTVGAKRDEVAYRVAAIYLDAERASRTAVLARRDADSQQKVLETVRAQVAEGRALPLAEKAAALGVARAKQFAESLDDDQSVAETSLAVALGFPAQDRVHPTEEERPAPTIPDADSAIRGALESNKELRQIESQIVSKELERRGERAARWPRIDLVAQYGLFAKFNNYAQYFNAFQRNNGQIGVSVQLPLLAGTAVGAQMAQTDTEIAHLKIELTNTRNRISSDLQQAYRDLHKADTAADVARLDLDVAREQLSVDLAQMQEGRLTLRQVEEARVSENQKWIAFYDAQYATEKARWAVMRFTGTLVAAVEALPR